MIGRPLPFALKVSLALAVAASSGCVTVYQPLIGLQRPVAIDPQLENFKGVNLVLRCTQDDSLDQSEGSKLCRRLRALFANQGANVDVINVRAKDKNEDLGAPNRVGNAPVPDLVIDVKSRLTHEEVNWLSLIACGFTLTLAPAYTEESFAQEISIRDGSGFLLLSDSLQERFSTYIGVGAWALNGLLDWLVRPKDAKLGGDAFKEEFSRDLYKQLTQLAFNARMRSLVLREFEPAPAATPPPKPATGASP